jgi:hypothetical protein
MKAILWKEFREALPLAAGMAAIVALLLVWLVWQGARWTSEGGCDAILIGLQVVSAMFSAVTGLAIGLKQSIPDTRGGLWAFLVHRPVPRRTIFLGRVLVGLGLYAAALMGPFFVAFLWLRWPGHLAAPFYFSMAGPLAVDLLAGVVWYFAALVVGQRTALWYGSRGLPFVTAVLCTIAVVQLPRAWQALAVVAVAGAAMSAAACGVFLDGGEIRRMPRAARAGLGVTLAVAILFVGAVVVGLVNGVVDDSSAPRYRYAFGHDGGIVRIEQEKGKWDRVSAVTDLAGKNLLDSRSPEAWSSLRLGNTVSVTLDPGTRTRAGYRWAGRRVAHIGQSAERINWDYSDVEGVIVAHDARTRRRIGTLGPNGYVPVDRGMAESFRDEFVWGAMSPDYLMILDNKTFQSRLVVFRLSAYTVSIHDRRVQKVFDGAPEDGVLGGNTTWIRWDKTHMGMDVLVTRRAIHISIPSETRRIAVPLEQDPARYDVVVGFRPESEPNVFIHYQPSERLGTAAARLPHYVVKANSDGRIVERQTLPPLPAEERINMPQAVLTGTVSPPLVWTLAAAYDQAVGKDVWAGWTAGGRPMIVFFVFLALGVLGSAAGNVLLARRHAFSAGRQIGWGLIGLLLSVTGFLLMLCMQEWLARVRCAACGRMRVVDREACQHCGRPIPPSPADGAEIFEPAPNAGAAAT